MESVWRESCEIKARPRLARDQEVDVAVIGAGMAGVLIADALQKVGKRVVVLEADRIAGGQTQNTTAKITSQHGLIYGKLIQTFGEEKARQYAGANQQAVRAFRDMIAEQNIVCDYEEKDAYVYGDDLLRLSAEAEAARRLGLPAQFAGQVPLPFPCTGAVCFREQAQFNPLKFIKAVSEGLTVFEHTPVQTIEEIILKANGYTVRAEHIVFATHFPFVNFPGLYFARMHQERSYVLALKNTPTVDGMFLGADEDSYSLRMYGDLLLFGGENHRTGENKDGGRYDALRRKAKELFPDYQEVAHWSAQDCMTADGVPYIGHYSPGKPNWYVATGFQKWGMTSSMVSAMVIRDLICGRESPYAAVFDPARFDTEAVSGVACETGHAVKGLTKTLLQVPGDGVNELPPGHGGVVFLNGQKVGVYKELDGTLHIVDIRCPHLGCQLEWNPDEFSWDCPCHGSRFDYTGKLISGPAQENITRNG